MDHNKLWKILKEMGIPDHFTCFLRNLYANWLSEEALQIAEERSENQEGKGKVLNTEFQRITRRDKKAFFNEKCIKLEENNRNGKTRDLLGKIEDIKGIFWPKVGTIKDRNGRDLVDAEEIKKRWKEYTELLKKKKKTLTKLDYYCGVVSHQEPYLESEVKWALGSTAVNKASVMI